ncbi:MAG: Gfo/Idh/MocA family protein, partial [Candidatus Eiseniibacteriota bacterium]
SPGCRAWPHSRAVELSRVTALAQAQAAARGRTLARMVGCANVCPAREPPGRAAPTMTTTSDPTSHSPAPSKADGSCRVAVAGLGASGIAHALALATIERATVTALADPSSSARRNASGMGFRVPTFADLDRLLARQQVDAVFVCAPVGARTALAKRALEAGAAVFVERPVAIGFAEVAALVEDAERRGARLMCSHPLVHQPVFARAAAEVAAGKLGAVRQARASVQASRVFSARAARHVTRGQGGGVVAHTALDLIFLLTRMLGLPTEGQATAIRLYGDHEDEVHARLKLAGGGEIRFDCSWSVPGYPVPGTVIELEGERGKLLVSDDAIEIDGPAGAHARWINADLPQPARFDVDGESRWLEDSAFIDWVLGGAPPPGAGREALHAHAVMHALAASIRGGGQAEPVPTGVPNAAPPEPAGVAS